MSKPILTQSEFKLYELLSYLILNCTIKARGVEEKAKEPLAELPKKKKRKRSRRRGKKGAEEEEN